MIALFRLLAAILVVYLAIELSVSSWVVACRQPANEKIKMHRMEAGDCETLLTLISDLRRKAAAEFGGSRSNSSGQSLPGVVQVARLPGSRDRFAMPSAQCVG